MLSILSQNKGVLTTYESVNVEFGIEHKWQIETKDFILGQYASKERCLEIIQEIVNAIYNISVYEMPEE